MTEKEKDIVFECMRCTGVGCSKCKYDLSCKGLTSDGSPSIHGRYTIHKATIKMNMVEATAYLVQNNIMTQDEVNEELLERLL